MATYRFDIQSLYQQAFGELRGNRYDAGQLNSNSPNKAEGYEVGAIDTEEGTEFVEMRNAINDWTPRGQKIFMPMRIGGVAMPNEPTISFELGNDIVETKLVGSKRKGTVKELISEEDDIMVIRGICFNFDSPKVYPEDEVKRIRDLRSRKESLLIESALTSLLGIERIVIKRVIFPDVIGGQNYQPYEIQCVSDESFDIEIE